MVATLKKKPAPKKSKTGKDIRVVGARTKKVAKAKNAAEEKADLEKQQLVNFRKAHKLAEQSDKWEIEYQGLKTQAKEIRGAISKNSVEIRRLLLANNEKMPLFDKQAAPTGQAAPSTNGHANGAPAAPAAEAWRTAKIVDVLHKEGSAAFTRGVNALIKAGVETVGQLEDRRAASFNGNWFENIDGLGREGADEIENAQVDYLAKLHGTKAIAAAETNGGGTATATKKRKKAK
jgi:hypothetical protein